MSSANNHRKRSHRNHRNGYTAQRRMRIRAERKPIKSNFFKRLFERITKRREEG